MLSIRNSCTVPLKNIEHHAEFFSFDGIEDGLEHIAIKLGNIKPNTIPLIRIHSECLTGDVFHSLKCDCGPQLDESIQLISKQGGYLFYLRQEGRGIGLYNKIDAYKLQESGVDTFSANRLLGFVDDLRNYTVVANMLKALGKSEVKIITGNSGKIKSLRESGIIVHEVITTPAHINDYNKFYINTKFNKEMSSAHGEKNDIS